MERVNDIKLSKEVFDITPNDNVLRDAINVCMCGLRQGTYKVKNRSEVSGGGRKPWRQKGTWRATQASNRDHQWRGGWVALGAVAPVYSIKKNSKERKLALKSALTYKAKANEIIVVDKIDVNVPKTKEMLALLESFDLHDKKVIIISEELTENVILASRNLQNVLIMEPNEINVLDIVNADYLLASVNAIKEIEEALK